MLHQPGRVSNRCAAEASKIPLTVRALTERVCLDRLMSHLINFLHDRLGKVTRWHSLNKNIVRHQCNHYLIRDERPDGFTNGNSK